MTIEPAIDMYNGNIIKYPTSYFNEFKFDFHFTNGDTWIYTDSCNKIEKFESQKTAVKTRNERWRIVDSSTGEIIEESS